jgi:putative phosphoribosyl transferase
MQHLQRQISVKVKNRRMARFPDRTTAGRELARLVAQRGVDAPAVVLALPRGGAPVAVEVARAIQAPLDVLVVRKLRTPGHPELAFGAVASGGVVWIDPAVRRRDQQEIAHEMEQVRIREQRYRPPGFRPVPLEGRTVVLVDDGIATGATVQAAVESVRLHRAAKVIVATPIAPPGAVRMLDRSADRVDVVEVLPGFGAVSVLYDDFREVPDSEVVATLTAATPPQPHPQPDGRDEPGDADQV